MNTFEKKIAKTKVRLFLYILMVGVGVLLIYSYAQNYHEILPIILGKNLVKNDIFVSALGIFLLTFPVITFNWWLKNRDQEQQFKDTQQQQNETLFSNALQLLCKQDDVQAKSVGLKELIRLRQAGAIEKKRIDSITSSKLQLQHAEFKKANFKEVNLEGADFTDANLTSANFEGADLSYAIFTEANMHNVNLLHADISGAMFCGAIFAKTDLKNVDFGCSYIRYASFAGADIREAKIENAHLKKAIWDDNTKFPEGLDPKTHDMIHISDISSNHPVRDKT